MKKLFLKSISLLLAVTLLLCGCGAPDVPQTEPSAEPTVVTDPTTEPTTEPTAEPTAEPTTEPTEEPTTEPTTEPTEEPTTQPTTAPTEPPVVTDPTTEPTTEPTGEDPVITLTGEEAFSDAAFIGDSVTLKLKNYDMKYKVMGSVTFLCKGSYSAGHAVNNTMLLNYRGEEMKIEDALAACGAKKVFILLGMNDIALYGIDKTIEHWGILIQRIRTTCPDIDIYIQSGTPIHKKGEVGSLNNKNMDKYNERLKVFAAENGCHYVDIATQLKTSSNSLADAYCSDEYVHFTNRACEKWINKLLEYLSAQ